ncbi:MAG: bifunctional diaminohydroxyphosphoribosylaminopyrimidine deaminase/5-amino-6-(5-phosphoribosylamino)uracil reductase RibD [Flavobacteriaceae bacterium]
MTRCLELAKKGIGITRPNPSVGAVIVLDNVVIGEGYTNAYGGNHAEVNAINSVKDTSKLSKATLYVTLEPCSHFGKTPPCSDLIIKHAIPNVVIGCVDTNQLVAGKGIQKLRDSDCNVIVGVKEKECLHHHRRFFTYQNKKRPHIILKWAETQDGFIAPIVKEKQEPVWITNNFSRQLVHKMRAKEHAILVGTNTVIADNPKLNVRDWKGINPIRVVIDRELKLPSDLHVFDSSAKTIVITEKRKENSANLSYHEINFAKNIPKQICEVLYQRNIQSLIVEGGTKTLQSFIDIDLWDEAYVFSGDVCFYKGVKSPCFSGKIVSEENINGNILKKYIHD